VTDPGTAELPGAGFSSEVQEEKPLPWPKSARRSRVGVCRALGARAGREAAPGQGDEAPLAPAQPLFATQPAPLAASFLSFPTDEAGPLQPGTYRVRIAARLCTGVL